MPELLFELGCEELPASSLANAAKDLQAGIAKRLTESGLSFDTKEPLFTPRRLIVCFENLADKQPDQIKEQRGPAIGSAFDAAGNPTPALLGFCRGQGCDVSEVTQDGDYVWIRKIVPGQDTLDLLSGILYESVFDVKFAKTMRWGNSTLRFARPIRWLCAIFGGQVVKFEIEGVHSGKRSRGHRFESAGEFDVTGFDNLIAELRDRRVEPCFETRVKRIRQTVEEILNGQDYSQKLVEENANLTEWPQAIRGSFNADFLELPIPVLETVMAKHERFFPVPESKTKLTNMFISVKNGGIEEAVSDGNSWVLNARFNDARFFFEEDKKKSLEEFLERTSSMNFQEKLGNVRKRADRLQELAGEVSDWTGGSAEERALASESGRLAKADLSTGLVSELDELQGVIGGEYARREGKDEAICWAISSQYDIGLNVNPNSIAEKTAIRLVIADNLDKLAGFLGLGFVPKGSSDPYALRRAVTQLIETAWNWPTVLPSYDSMFLRALDLFANQGVELNREAALSALKDVFASRYESLLEGRHDICAAATSDESDLMSPRLVRMKKKVMEILVSDTEFVQSATRPANIVASAKSKEIDFSNAVVSSETLDSPEADSLLGAVESQGSLAKMTSQAEDEVGLANALRPLTAPVNAFFESTMVMVENESTRNARLKLLDQCSQVFQLCGDFSKVVIDG